MKLTPKNPSNHDSIFEQDDLRLVGDVVVPGQLRLLAHIHPDQHCLLLSHPHEGRYVGPDYLARMTPAFNVSTGVSFH